MASSACASSSATSATARGGSSCYAGVDSYDELRMRDGLGSFLSVDVSKTQHDTTLWSNTTFVSPSFVDQSALDHPVRMPLSRILHRATAFEGKRNKTSSRAHPQVEGAGNTKERHPRRLHRACSPSKTTREGTASAIKQS